MRARVTIELEVEAPTIAEVNDAAAADAAWAALEDAGDGVEVDRSTATVRSALGERRAARDSTPKIVRRR